MTGKKMVCLKFEVPCYNTFYKYKLVLRVLGFFYGLTLKT